MPPSELRFPYNVRRALGLWNRLYVDGKSFTPDPKRERQNQSRRLSRCGAPAHCSQCHSSRNLLGGIVKDTEFAGAPGLEGKAHVPNITPSEDGIGDWTEEDIAYLLETGNKPDYDTIGETMVPVQREHGRSSRPTDRKAIAAYIKSLPPRPDAVPRAEEIGGTKMRRGRSEDKRESPAETLGSVLVFPHSEKGLAAGRQGNSMAGKLRAGRGLILGLVVAALGIALRSRTCRRPAARSGGRGRRPRLPPPRK